MESFQNTLKIDLSTFFLSISSTAMMALGAVPSAQEENLELAQQNIELLELMHEKTRGNRTPEEDQLIEKLLFETRMKYVERKSAHSKDASKTLNT